MVTLLKPYKPLFYTPKHRYFIISGGRGSAKSWHIAYWLLWLTYEQGHVILYTRYTMTAAHLSIIPEFVDKIELTGATSHFEVTRTEIINKVTGSKILFRGIKTSSGNQTANLKSIQGVTTWVLDEAEELTDKDTFDRINLSIRQKTLHNRVILILNPTFKSHWIYTEFVTSNRNDTMCLHTDFRCNIKNLSQSFLDEAKRTQEKNPLRYRHLFLGEWLDEAEGLLWNRAIIDRQRCNVAPTLERVIVAIDPAATATMHSDETGIIVLGRDKEYNIYILEDLSGKYSPAQWGATAVAAAKRHNASAIVAERNQGGDMVESVIRQHDKQIRYIAVVATKGKAVRAEPVYSLYEQGKVWHVGQFPQLEAQMVTFNPDGDESPDRVDAMVWGVTEISATRSQFLWV